MNEAKQSSAEEAIHKLTEKFGERWPDDYAAQIVKVVLNSVNASLKRRLEIVIGDYVDLQDPRYSQMLKYVLREADTIAETTCSQA